MLNAVWVDELDAASAGRVRELLLAVQGADGRPEIGEIGILPSRSHRGSHLLARSSGELVGYVRLDTGGDVFGRKVAELLVDKAGASAGSDKLRVWAHGDHPGAARLADREGFTRARELLVLRAEATEWPEPVLRNGVRLRTFVPGQDEQAVIDVNSQAFDWHPEQGSLTVAELRAAEAEDWFDAGGLFLAENAEGRVVGFHWTKAHPARPRRFGGGPVGEVYVVGVSPDAQGGGLGRALTLAGLRHLSGQGLRQFILYVEGDNAPARAVYEGLGFRLHEVDVQYAR
jgi:mycothiol synthase